MNNYHINLAMFEFALIVQSVVNKGWKLKEIYYGNESWDINPNLKIEKDGIEKTIYNPLELGGLE